MIYSDKDISSAPDLHLSQERYYSVFPELFRTAEMADFFSAYQLVRSDREASLALWEDYFGDRYVVLYYEEALPYEPWGKIAVTETEHTYLVNFGGWNSISEYLVSVDGETFSVAAFVGEEEQYKAEMSVTGGVVSVNSLSVVSDDGFGTTVTMEVLEPVSVTRCSHGEYETFPSSGAISYVLHGKVDDEFVVRYDGNGCVIERDGMQASYK